MLYSTALYYTVLCYAIYATILCYTILCCAMLCNICYYTVQYHTVLCYAMLYMLLYCAVLYCTILYCAVLCYVCYYTVLCYAMLYMLLYCAILRYFNRWYSVMNKHLLTSVLSRERVENCAGFWTKPLPLYYEPRLDPLSLVKKYCVENKRILFSQCTLPLYKNDWGRLTGRARVGIPLKCLIPPPPKMGRRSGYRFTDQKFIPSGDLWFMWD